MAVDPKANEVYWTKRANLFPVGKIVWINGTEFTVIKNAENELTLRPVITKIS
jgi:hypothetical protein